MADKTKLADRTLPSNQRYVIFTSGELATGDLIRAFESLGRAADTLTIDADAASDLSIRINTKQKVNQRRRYPEEEPAGWHLAGAPNLTNVTEFDTGTGSIPVGNAVSAVTYTLTDIPIRDVEVTFTAGTFTINIS